MSFGALLPQPELTPLHLSLLLLFCSRDSHINFALDNFQWVKKAAREIPNAYCEGVIQYLRSVL